MNSITDFTQTQLPLVLLLNSTLFLKKILQNRVEIVMVHIFHSCKMGGDRVRSDSTGGLNVSMTLYSLEYSHSLNYSRAAICVTD